VTGIIKLGWGCLTVNYKTRIGVMTQNLEGLGDGEVFSEAGQLSLKLILILQVGWQRQDVPRVQGLPVDSVERKGGYLVSL
jgi:hypothetical protein